MCIRDSISSVYILHQVLRHHLSQFPEDKCTEALTSKLYVDNLVMSCNSLEELKYLYSCSYDRLFQGGFVLRSFNTNNKKMQQIMKKDNKYVIHDSAYEKVLVYRYNTSTDTININQINLNQLSN